MSLRSEAKAAWGGEHETAARDLLIGRIGDPAGEVTALTVEHQAIGPTFALTVFTDADLHIGVQAYTDPLKDPLIGFVELGGDGKWTFVRSITSLAQMGQFVDSTDPDTAA